MKVERRERERVITQTEEYEVYIADDGKEFDTPTECLRHEGQTLFDALVEKHKTGENETDGIPIDLSPYYIDSTSFYLNFDNDFVWVRIADEKDLEDLKELCEDGFSTDLKIGDLVCIEHDNVWDGSYFIWRGEYTIGDMRKALGYLEGTNEHKE